MDIPIFAEELQSETGEYYRHFLKSDVERFFERIKQVGDCWEFQVSGNGNRKKRPVFNMHVDYRKKPLVTTVQRHMMQLAGIKVEGFSADMKCGNTHCCNPEHMDIVTINEMRGLCSQKQFSKKAEPKPVMAPVTHKEENNPVTVALVNSFLDAVEATMVAMIGAVDVQSKEAEDILTAFSKREAFQTLFGHLFTPDVDVVKVRQNILDTVDKIFVDALRDISDDPTPRKTIRQERAQSFLQVGTTRKARKNGPKCSLCNRVIKKGDRYFYKGSTKAHEKCVKDFVNGRV